MAVCKTHVVLCRTIWSFKSLVPQQSRAALQQRRVRELKFQTSRGAIVASLEFAPEQLCLLPNFLFAMFGKAGAHLKLDACGVRQWQPVVRFSERQLFCGWQACKEGEHLVNSSNSRIYRCKPDGWPSSRPRSGPTMHRQLRRISEIVTMIPAELTVSENFSFSTPLCTPFYALSPHISAHSWYAQQSLVCCCCCVAVAVAVAVVSHHDQRASE
eukprot:SAG31_NODE_348_length_17296_cov_5.089482_6_plen_214_part_00